MTAEDVLCLALARQLVVDGRVRPLRVRNRLSQSDVARAVGCSSAAINRYEANKRAPTGRVGLAYAEFVARLATIEGKAR